MTAEILIAANLPADHIAALEERFTVHKLLDAEDEAAFLSSVGPRVRALVTSGFKGFNAAMIDALPNLEIVSVWGAGTQALDLDAARERGIAVTNTPDGSRIAVAELGMALMLAAARWVPDGDQSVRTGRWAKEGYGRNGVGLEGKVCGIVAMGLIGRAVAARAQAFGMTVLYHGPREKPDLPFTFVSEIAELASQSDFLILCCPETPETRGMVNKSVLEALGPDGTLVNIARGGIVDETALIAALDASAIRAAALDVFADEPNVPEALRSSERVVSVPHVGTQTEDVRRRRGDGVIANLEAHFSNSPLPSPVNTVS